MAEAEGVVDGRIRPGEDVGEDAQWDRQDQAGQSEPLLAQVREVVPATDLHDDDDPDRCRDHVEHGDIKDAEGPQPPDRRHTIIWIKTQLYA